jgi:hypothetical protein
MWAIGCAERLRFPRFPKRESGEMLGFAHIPSGTHNQPEFLNVFEERGGEILNTRAELAQFSSATSLAGSLSLPRIGGHLW